MKKVMMLLFCVSMIVGCSERERTDEPTERLEDAIVKVMEDEEKVGFSFNVYQDPDVRRARVEKVRQRAAQWEKENPHVIVRTRSEWLNEGRPGYFPASFHVVFGLKRDVTCDR